jgi:hypothetical protein
VNSECVRLRSNIGKQLKVCYIDFMMGWCVGNFGWGKAVLVKEAKTFRGPDYVYPGYSYGVSPNRSLEFAIRTGVEPATQRQSRCSVRMWRGPIN